MYILVLLVDENNEVNEELAFTHDFDEMPQVGDIIQLVGNEIDEKWYPDLQQYGASEFFTIERRGWRVVDSEKTFHPFIVVKNNECGQNPFIF